MALTKEELQNLMQLIGLTQDDEINCQQCLALVAEFAEQRLAGRSTSENLLTVEQHLSLCAECRDEYEALRRALETADADEPPAS